MLNNNLFPSVLIPRSTNMILLITLLVVEMIFTFTFSVISIITIVRSHSLRSRFTNVLIIFLFLSHALTNMAYMSTLWTLVLSSKNLALKTGTLNTRDFCVGLTICFSTLLSSTRFISVYKPFFYENLTKKHAVIIILGSISFLIIFSIWRLFSTLAYFAVVVFSNGGGIVVLICNVYLYRLVKRQCNDIASTCIGATREAQIRERNITRKRSLKALKMCIWISVSYFLTIVPGAVMLFISRVFYPNKISDDYAYLLRHPDTRLYLDSANSMISISNGIWDVLIFYKFNSEARQGFFNLLGTCCTHCRSDKGNFGRVVTRSNPGGKIQGLISMQMEHRNEVTSRVTNCPR